jgi:hypothetical protein
MPIMGRNGHNSGSLWLSRAYEVIEYDPEIENMQKVWRKARIKESDLAVLAGLSPGTVTKMFNGTTHQPRHSTFGKMAAAMGGRYELVVDGTPNYENEIPKAREQYRDYRKQQRANKRRRRK